MRIYSGTVLFILLTSVTTNLLAGIRWVDIGVNGLTCSMCSRSVEMSLRKLDFVDSVGMSLELTEGRIYVKDVKTINLKRITKAITDAGFSVRFVRLQLDFKDIQIDSSGFFSFKGQRFQWLEFKYNALKNEVALTVIDDGFLPKREANQWKKKLAISPDQNIFHLINEK